MPSDLETPEPARTLGGTLCLDFINANIPSQTTPPNSIVPYTYTDLTSWGLEIGFLSIEQARQLERLAKRNTEHASNTMRRNNHMRQILHRIFSSLAAHLEPAEGDLEKLLEAHTRAVAAATLVSVGGVYKLHWAVKNDTEIILHAISHDAIRLLGDATLERVKACPDCGWLFLDLSRNGSRRWCSMDTCGARDKMRRYYQRNHSRLQHP
jgi:predicted RNA-binding Zn ribbon-like protein